MEILLIRTPNGFAPADDEAQDQIRKYKLGSLSRLDVVEMRNGAFFRKWWALVKLGYDYFADSCEQHEHKGQRVLPNFNRFRKDITILAGFHHAVWNVNGEMRLEADSLAWASMTEETFGKLYDATIQVLLNKVFNGKRVQAWTEEELRGVVEDIERFAA
jgi:hypothetical protein